MRRQGRSNRAAGSSRMKTLLERVLVGSDGSTVVEECRRCGTTLESGGPRCPACGRDDIARYHIE